MKHLHRDDYRPPRDRHDARERLAVAFGALAVVVAVVALTVVALRWLFE